MSNKQENEASADGPDGSIFLPKNSNNMTARDWGNLRLAIMLGRGEAAGLSPEQQEVAYTGIETFERQRLKIAINTGRVAIAPEL